MKEEIAQSSIIQNLKDAGCEADFIDNFISMINRHQNKEVYVLLREWRNCLLDEIHSNQHKLDCLDYLIRKLGGEK